MEIQEALEAYVEEYFDRMDPRSVPELMHGQDGRVASLAFGAAGIAYAYWHGAVTTNRKVWLRGARRWIRQAHERRDENVAFFPRHPDAGPPEDWRDLAAGAFLYGRVGIDFVRALVAHTTADGPELERALEEFAAGCRHSLRGPDASTELYSGLAGNLQSTALLWQTIGDPRLRKLGSDLADRLVRRTSLHLDEGCAIRWHEPRGTGLAHGVAGVLFALTSWCRASGEARPPGLRPTLDRLLDGALNGRGRRFCSRPTFVASLCNGFSGLALVALAAHEELEEERYRDDALRAARLALDAIPDRPDLCCGRAGVASLCLALHAVDPEGLWRQRALTITASALLAEDDAWEVVGLYGGEAALPCLVVDLLSGRHGGPPALTRPPEPNDVKSVNVVMKSPRSLTVEFPTERSRPRLRPLRTS